jgi:hypothetical protein
VYRILCLLIVVIVSCTAWAGGLGSGKRHSEALVREAELRDLASQAERAIFYARQEKIDAGREEEKIIRLGRLLHELENLFKLSANVGKILRTNEGDIEAKLAEGMRIGADILRTITEQMKEKHPWFTSDVLDHQSVDPRRLVLTKGGPNRFFYGTVVPLDKLEISEPFRFDFLDHNYKAKAVNKRMNQYRWEGLEKGFQAFAKRHYPMNVSVSFGTMKPWPLMSKFSWIPSRHSESEIEEMLFRNDLGQVLWRSGFHSVLNIWHPVVLKYERDWLRALGKYCQDRNIAVYELFNEMGLSAKKRAVGYSKHARISFHRYLKKKYASINDLNRRLATSYAGFEAIEPPSGDSYRKRDAPIGLIYEFERFRKESLADYMQEMIAELRKADANPKHAISSQFAGWFNDAYRPKMSARDFLKLACLDWDLYGVHCAGDGRFPAITLLYHYCINRYAHKIYWNDEFWWDYREAADQAIEDEQVLRAVAERNLWRHIAYGVKGFNIFPGLYASEAGGLLTRADTMKYATGAFPLVIGKMNKYAHVFLNAHILNQRVAILQPTTTLDITGCEFLANENAMKLSDWMLSEHWIPFYVPEECIIDGRANLDEFGILISPYAPFVPGGLVEKVEKWLKSGGIFIAVGPFGGLDRYGKTQETFASASFEKGSPGAVVIREYGKGRLIITDRVLAYTHYLKYIRPALEPFRIVSCDVKPQVGHLAARRDRFTGERDVSAQSDIDLVPWEDEQGNTYLFVINLNPSNGLRTSIRMRGEFTRVLDLGIDGGFPVPTVRQSGSTAFSSTLRPGQGTIFRLH